MNLVVSFLSMLGSDEENGGVKRMLGVCSEFERISKVVLDKAEKETSSRRKRKSDGVHEQKAKSIHPPPMPNGMIPNISGMFSTPPPNGVMSQNGYGGSPSMGAHGSPPAGSDWQAEYGSNYATPTPDMNGFQDMGYSASGGLGSPENMGVFAQPFVPQDLWQMPMNHDYGWADMTFAQYPSFENGIMGDPLLQNANNQHLQHQPL